MPIDWLLERMMASCDQPAVIWRDYSVTYGGLLDAVRVWRDRLVAHGIRPAQVVALEGDYSPSAVALLLALIEQRAILVPLTKAVETHRAEFLDIAQVQHVITLDDADGWRWESQNTAVTHPLIRQVITQGQPGLVLFSSGSTGTSKAVLHNMAALLEKFKTPRPPLRTLMFLLFDHIGGLNTLFYVLSSGGVMVCVDRRHPELICQAIEQRRVELLPTSPTFLNMLLFSEAYRQYDLSSLKRITYGTEVMMESTLRRIHELFPGVELQQTYGLSELGILRSKSKDASSLWVKIGGEGFETKVVKGTLWIRARSSMVGYLNAPQVVDADGWMDTGDAVEVDGEYLRILGRQSQLINVGGQKVYPVEVENVLMELDNVRDVAVSGERNPITGYIVVAKITLNEPEDLASVKARVRAFCAGRLAPYKIPVKIELTFEAQVSGRYKKMRRHASDAVSGTR